MAGGEDGRVDDEALSTWGSRLVAFLAIALALSLCWIWIETFYRGVSSNVALSFKSFDAPTLAGRGPGFGPLLGHHYFGDFQIPLSYAWDLRQSISPYLRPAPQQYPPFTQVLFVPLTYLNFQLSAVVYLALSSLAFLVPLWLLLAPVAFAQRVVFLVFTAILTTGPIAAFDRGSNVALTVALVAWSLWAWRTERWVWCAAFLAAAIALKGYPAALLVVPLAFRRYKFAFIVGASAVAANLLVMATYPGGYVDNLRQVTRSLQGSYVPESQLFSWSLYSVIPKSVGLLFGPEAMKDLLAPEGIVTWIPALAYFGGLYFVVRRGRVPQWCWGTLTLASIQLLVPISYVYTAMWASIAAVWYAQGNLVDRYANHDDESGTRLLRVLLLLALVATLAPSVFTITGNGSFETSLFVFASPLLLLATMVVAVVSSLRTPARSPALV